MTRGGCAAAAFGQALKRVDRPVRRGGAPVREQHVPRARWQQLGGDAVEHNAAVLSARQAHRDGVLTHEQQRMPDLEARGGGRAVTGVDRWRAERMAVRGGRPTAAGS
eukprot:201169-Chlamydomonas_euryale.AAC.1